MTVGELIEALKNYKPELRVLVDGYETGYDDPSIATRLVLDQGWDEPSVLGKYDDAYPDNAEGSFNAFVLSRYNRS